MKTITTSSDRDRLRAAAGYLLMEMLVQCAIVMMLAVMATVALVRAMSMPTAGMKVVLAAEQSFDLRSQFRQDVHQARTVVTQAATGGSSAERLVLFVVDADDGESCVTYEFDVETQRVCRVSQLVVEGAMEKKSALGPKGSSLRFSYDSVDPAEARWVRLELAFPARHPAARQRKLFATAALRLGGSGQ